MNRPRLLCALAALLAIQLACSSGGTPDGSAKPIGSIQQLKGGVRAGPESALQEVSPSRDMFDNEAAQVYNQGKARLDYGYGITFTLYNDTTTGGTSVSASGQVKVKLAQGGLMGTNPPGTRTEVQLPNGGSVIILGTTYSIDYDPATGVVRVYNFDGTVRYSVGGGGLQDLPQGTLVVFDRTQVLELIPGLRLSADLFDKYATDLDSPMAAMDVLLKEQRSAGPTPEEPAAFLEGIVIKFTDCRYGPGDVYLSRTALKDGERIRAIGRDAGGRWILVQAVEGQCWINAELFRLEGDAMRLPDLYRSPAGLPRSPLLEKIVFLQAQRKGDFIFVHWEEYQISQDLGPAGLPQYIVEVWTCVDGRPGFYALGTDETSMQFRVDESCGMRWHADVMGQAREGFWLWAEIVAP